MILAGYARLLASTPRYSVKRLNELLRCSWLDIAMLPHWLTGLMNPRLIYSFPTFAALTSLIVLGVDKMSSLQQRHGDRVVGDVSSPTIQVYPAARINRGRGSTRPFSRSVGALFAMCLFRVISTLVVGA